MRFLNSIGVTALAAGLMMSIGAAAAFDDSKYPDLKGQWRRFGAVPNTFRFGLAFDPGKPFRAEEPPLTPEYQAIYQANIDDMEKGGQGIDPTYNCLSPGMPRVMAGYSIMEFVVTPETTYIPMTRDHDFMRHIYTDGRDFPANMTVEPRFLGYSIGKWIDTDGDGRYDTLEVETRGMKGPRVFDASGIPLHEDNETIVQERIYLDKADKNLLHDDITAIDHALTRPWRVAQTFRRIVSDKPLWFGHEICGEGNAHVGIGKEIYYLSGDGLLMPAMKDQPPPICAISRSTTGKISSHKKASCVLAAREHAPSASGHLRPSCTIAADDSLSPDSFRMRRMLLRAESGQKPSRWNC